MYIDPSKPDRTTMLTEATTNQLMNARHLYYMAKQNLESKQTIRLFAGTNLLQDAVEALLWAAASHKGISRDRSEVMQLYDDVNAALSPEHLSFRPAVVQLNKIRINSKHYGICPDQKETGRLLTSMAEFLRETTRTAFSVNFWTISLLDLLKKDEIKTALTDAQAAFDRGEYLICLIGCRKAIYLLFEFWYNVEKFRYNSQTAFGLGAFSRAPLFARNPEWIANYVNDLFEYIQIDNDDLEKDVLRKGIESATFWNIWRGTPAVYRYEASLDWLVKRDLTVEAGATEGHASYILEQTIDIALRVQDYNHRIRVLSGGSFTIKLKHDGTKVYSKADRARAVSAVTESGLRMISVVEGTVGFDGETYWKVSHLGKGETLLSGIYYVGYIHDDDVDWAKGS